jgi:GAF domain-containing protein
MLKTFGKFFAPPVFEDEEKTRSAYYINAIALISIPVLVLFFLARVAQGNSPFAIENIILLGLIGVLTIVWILEKRGEVRLAGYLHISMIWIASTFLALGGSGVRGTGFTSYFVVMLLAGLLLGVRTAVGIAAISILSGFGLAYAETIGIIIYRPGPAFGVAIETTVLFIFSTVFMVLMINSLQNALKDAKANARELKSSNRQLSGLRDALELRVQERTAALEQRAIQLQTVSSVARTIASVQDLDTLLPKITNLVSEQFGFYHAGIFLVDETAEFAVLRAANSEGGAAMLDRQHKLRLDTNSIVGYVASRGELRVASDVGIDSVYFNNPDLPNTRSEMALPLRVGDRVIGVLDVQSMQPSAFVEGNIATLTTLADQVAIAIENARLFSEARQALNESENTFTRYVKQEWGSFANQVKNTGYVFDGNRTTALDKKDKREKVKSLAQTGRLSLEKESAELTIPIKFRGQTIGILDVKSKRGSRQWTQDEITLLEAAAERAAFALENARLVESAQRRAARERAIGEISAKIGAVSDLDAIMQTAVEELGRKISGTTEVTLELDIEEK